MADFLVYWKPETVEGLSPLLKHAASNQLARVETGDTLWITTAWEGDLHLVGRIKVGRRVAQDEAETALGGDLWEADHHVLAEPGTEMPAVRIRLSGDASKLRFLGRSDRLTVHRGKVNPQELQAMRRLSPSSVALLATALKKAVSFDATAVNERQYREAFDRLLPLPAIQQNVIDALLSAYPSGRTNQEIAALFGYGDPVVVNGAIGKLGHALFDHLSGGRSSARDFQWWYVIATGHETPKGWRWTLRTPVVQALRSLGWPMANDEEQSSAVELRRGVSQGINLSPRARMELDAHAMRRAITHFVRENYRVEDVHTRKPVDLICHRGSETLHVEVKCTQTTGGEIMLTPNEVTYAREHVGRMCLFLVHSVTVLETPEAVEISDGIEEVLPWRIDDSRLTPAVYKYRLR